MTNEPKVFIVMLNYNGIDHLKYSIGSVLDSDYENFELVVVDNNSSDGSVEYLESNYPSVTILKQSENRGVPAGNNVGVRYAMDNAAEFILIANNDIRVHPKWIKGAIEAAQSDPNIGIVGYDVHGRLKRIPLEDYNESVENWQELEYKHEDGYIDSMAALFDTDVFKSVGLFDEEYFIYGDETDLEIRAKKAGFKLARTNIPIWHHSMGTMEETPVKSAWLAMRNRLRVSIKHDPLTGILRSIAQLYNTGCNPFLDYDENSAVMKRRRPRSIIFNFFIITAAVLWNLIHIRQTLEAKRRDSIRGSQ
ncbi:glycosyltransferase family 2 protein [Halorubrum sp. SP9]|uniref:glycosyltransferase family 2 protein n=1 Tax=Halorubrum sp. SP9 TaxID=1537267 RepID=UPI0010F9F7B3|nr:glycosyltransferase family 2 protein [Halorubrum sp. SP9]TKX66105.1 glycosyltransferase family 2 protein [Halorubrum sp. SP9]